MIYKEIINTRCRCQLFHMTRRLSAIKNRSYSSAASTNDTKVITSDVEDQENDTDANLFESQRNKSGLQHNDYNIAHNKMPSYTKEELEIMKLKKYRSLFGKYGSASNIDMKSLWPSEQEMEFLKEREKLLNPHSVLDMINMAKTAKIEEERSIMERQEQLTANLKKLQKWKRDMAARMEKKEKEAKLALEMKQKQIEDVREILGYKISPHDPKFTEILEQKLEEDRKKAKKEKKLLKQQLVLKKLTDLAKQDAMAPESSKDSQQSDSLYGKKIE